MVHSFDEVFAALEKKRTVDPAPADASQTTDAYHRWVEHLQRLL
jgi:hypothetical protein